VAEFAYDTVLLNKKPLV